MVFVNLILKAALCFQKYTGSHLLHAVTVIVSSVQDSIPEILTQKRFQQRTQRFLIRDLIRLDI